MLCPDCEQPAPGGSLCTVCGAQVPERETFEGQGTHYLLVLTAISLLLVVATLLYVSRGLGVRVWLATLVNNFWLIFYALAIFIPFGLGVRYWFLLREEEVSITDEAISRRSHWGDEHLAWQEVTAYRQRHILLRQTRLGHVTWVSRIMRDHKLIARMATLRYELVGASTKGRPPHEFLLEPGTLNDMPWLLALIEERVGPPSSV